MIGLPAVIALVASWLLGLGSALVLGVFVGAVLGIAVKPHTVVLLLTSRGAVREERWPTAQLNMRVAITSAGLSCLGIGAALLVGGPGKVSVVVSSGAFGLGFIIISSAPDRPRHFDAEGPESPKRWVRISAAASRSDGWAGFGAGVLAWAVTITTSIPVAVIVIEAAVALGAFVPPVSKLVRLIWRRLKEALLRRWLKPRWIRPASVFWAWVPYDKPDEKGIEGKDRPVICISTARGTYFGLHLTSKDHTNFGHVIELLPGKNFWDSQERVSYVSLRPIHKFTRGTVGIRYKGQLDDRRFQRVLSTAREVNGALPGEMGSVGKRSRWISPVTRMVAGQGIAIWFSMLVVGACARGWRL